MDFDVEQLIETHKDYMRQVFNLQHEFHIMAVALVTRNPLTGEVLAEPTPAVIPLTPNTSKDDYAFAVKEIAERGAAVAVVFMAETWILHPTMPEEIARADRDGLANHPDRREGLMLTVETSQSARSWLAEITRKRGQPSLGEWVEQPGNGEGRFSRLLREKSSKIN